MNKCWRIRFLFLASIFLPFIAIAFLPWWLSAPITIVFLFVFIATVIKAIEHIEEEKKEKNT
jgi:hypothetical protein